MSAIDWEEYRRRVDNLEQEGLTTSDAQAVVDAEMRAEAEADEADEDTEPDGRDGYDWHNDRDCWEARFETEEHNETRK